MRIIVKNATFSIYGLDDVSAYLNAISENYGGIDSITPIRNLLVALGADGSNQIWSKLKALYLPVLAVPADGANVLYEVIEPGDYPATGSYTIEEKRGIRPATLGGSIGLDSSLPSGLTSSGISFFGIGTQSASQTLGSSSGIFVAVGDLKVTWRSTALEVTSGRDSSTGSVTNSNGFSEPIAFAVSGVENGNRTVVTAEGTDTDTLAASLSGDFCLSGSNTWCATSVLGVCEGLTSAEAAIVVTALETFITEYGVLD